MHPQNRRYFAIIVHYGDEKKTQRALASLRAGSKQPDHIVVVDHDSDVFTVPAAPDLTTVRPNQNGGYGAGINVGLGVLLNHGAKANDIIIAMNNDVQVQQDTLAELDRFWRDNPEPALVGVAVEEGERQVTDLSSVDLLTGRTHIYPATAGPRPWRGNLNYVHGAFLSAPYEVFLTVKGLPEHYFMYWEDVLFSYRVQQSGWPLKIASSARITHEEDHDSPPSDNQLYYLVRNGALFLEQETSWPTRPAWWLLNRFRLGYHSLRNTKPVIRQALRDATKGTTGPVKKIST